MPRQIARQEIDHIRADQPETEIPGAATAIQQDDLGQQ
tara:strand:+ start:773 stop:886 length:114 start_codon:yes stop_codon:yes gene_type:complete